MQIVYTIIDKMVSILSEFPVFVCTLFHYFFKIKINIVLLIESSIIILEYSYFWFYTLYIFLKF